MTVYICKNCRFRLNSEKTKECPYCGRNSLEKEKSATELIDEVDDILSE